MRVLLVTDWYPATPDDPAGSFVRAQALAVAARHDVTVVQLDGRARPLGTSREGALRVIRPTGRAVRGLATAANLSALAAAVRREGLAPDVVHAHGFSAGLAGLVLARVRRVPLVVSEHASVFATGSAGRTGGHVARIVFGAADLVCPVSASQEQMLREAGHRGPFRVVPNPVDVELFRPADTTATAMGPPRAVTVGSLRAVKGTADVVEAAAIVAASGRELALDVIGDGPLRAKLEARVRALGLTDRVRFHGALAPVDVAARMRAARFAVVPSRWETFSVALSEALACGLPVVATSVGALAERVHEANGILCPPGDPLGLAAALERMLDEIESFDRERIAIEARDSLAPAVVADAWDEVYADMGRRITAPRARR